jgi:hypothetical protein
MTDMLRLIILAFLTLGFAVKPAEAADCSMATLELPDLNVLKLPDGDQVVATVMTERGKLEVHVHVAKGVASEPTFVMAGKPMIKIPESKLPRSSHSCLRHEVLASHARVKVKIGMICLIRSWCVDGGCCAIAECDGSGWTEPYCEPFLVPLQ